jgi:hypothetical protein
MRRVVADERESFRIFVVRMRILASALIGSASPDLAVERHRHGLLASDFEMDLATSRPVTPASVAADPLERLGIILLSFTPAYERR